MVVIGLGFLAHTFPVVAAEIPRIGGAAGAIIAGLFLEPFQLFQRCCQHPCLHRTIGITQQPEDAIAAANIGFKVEHRLDAGPANPLDQPGGGAVGVDDKAFCANGRLPRQ